jgi:hypothetical protein
MSTFEDNQGQSAENKTGYLQKMRIFWEKFGEKIILFIGIVLVALVSFEAGFLEGRKSESKPIEINQPACAPCPKSGESAGSGEKAQLGGAKTGTQLNIEDQKCAYVASKNSNKYHLSTCQFAQKIKPENKTCFSSAGEAEGRGFQAAKCCIK